VNEKKYAVREFVRYVGSSPKHIVKKRKSQLPQKSSSKFFCIPNKILPLRYWSEHTLAFPFLAFKRAVYLILRRFVCLDGLCRSGARVTVYLLVDGSPLADDANLLETVAKVSATAREPLTN
jgi:hypothetical protein